jgi:hypothetical protein
MLHIVNGLVTLNLLDRTELRGARVSGDDIFAEGPVVERLQTATAWRLRAEYLQRKFGIPKDEYLARKEERDRSLKSFAYHEEIILWFEADLFCQLNLLYLLDWFGRRDLGNSRLTLICPDEPPTSKHFRGLGGLNPKQLASLFEDRSEVSPQQLHLAKSAWAAYASPDPRSIENLLEEGTEELPKLFRALQAHLERFPSTRNGLNTIEHRTLDILKDGPRKFPDLFSLIRSGEGVFSHGLGDVQFTAYLLELADPDAPLIRMEHFPGVLPSDPAKRNTGKWNVKITDLGKDVLKGREDNVNRRGIERWLGGVHLKSPDAIWRWDQDSRKLISPQAE